MGDAEYTDFETKPAKAHGTGDYSSSRSILKLKVQELNKGQVTMILLL